MRMPADSEPSPEKYDSELFQWISASPYIPNMKASQTMSEYRGGGTFHLSGRGKGVDWVEWIAIVGESKQ